MMTVKVISYIKSMPFRWHLAISFLIRLGFIVYGEFQDRHAEVPFTDIDYRVVTDGARYVLEGGSPYSRHTYRYTPLLAFLLIGNILVHETFGKIVFSLFDVLLGILIRQIIIDEYQHTFEANATSVLRKNKRFNERSKATIRFQAPPKYEQRATWSSLFWLYNPMAMVIATRGNGDALTSLFILATIYALQRSVARQQQNRLPYVIFAGIMHGLAIHFRLYPIVFSLAYYLFLGCEVFNQQPTKQSIMHALFRFSQYQLTLVFSTISTLLGLTALFYQKYGYEFLYEAYIYHLVRKDTRHNFSLYFYMNYLNSQPMLFEKILTFLPQLIILLTININFGMHRKTLGFCIFLQAFTVVIFNPVVTSQYFIWYLAILPICLKNFRTLRLRHALSYCGLWCSVQAVWLYSAYLLEFKGWNTFGFIWMQGCIFFGVNIFIMKVLIDHFDVVADF